MAVSRSLALLAPILAALPAGAAGVARSEDNLARGTCLDIKIRLPKAETYIRGETDPVLDLKIEVTISNVMPKDDPVRGIGELYRPVKLSPHDFIQFEILPVEDVAAEGGEGGGEPKPKPKPIRRDMPLLPAEPENLRDSKYLGPGESETVVVDAGRHYLIDRPGIYSIKARMFGPNGIVSNEEKFRVLPFKKVDQSAAELERLWKQYERDRLEFPFMVYQVRTNAAFDEVIYVQRVVNSRTDHYEFH
ncbi:MAG: hypothetical protein N3A38_00005, partial [Planctomycetota bacterium]|nr:hypothetical protein [Planctomycetota bacterium]